MQPCYTASHTLTHSMTLYLLNEDLVCVCESASFSYTPVSTARLHNSVMNNNKNTSQLFKQSSQGHD